MAKQKCKWVPEAHQDSYLNDRLDEVGRVIPRYSMNGELTRVIAHVWGPSAESEADESRNLTKENTPNWGPQVLEETKKWVEDWVKKAYEK